MERFLERVSVSDYRNHFILKDSMLVASIIGIDMRATMEHAFAWQIGQTPSVWNRIPYILDIL